MRPSLLRHDPQLSSVSMRTLVGIANAIEQEAVRRYDLLAQAMDRRGEAATAAAFRVMREEERGHVEAVERWAAALREPVPAVAEFTWRLPEELSSSWDDIAASALLTPYRAFAIAVDNEQRAFSFYTYLAAHADDAQIMAEAEKLAAEELRHAASLRRWRRRAYHRDRRTAASRQPGVMTVDALHALLARHEAAIAASHRALARRLEEAGDPESARLLERLLETPSQPIAQTPGLAGAESDAAAELARIPAPATGPDDPAHLLVAAQKPLEALSEALEAILGSAQGALFTETERAMTSVITRLARISLQTGHRMQASGS